MGKVYLIGAGPGAADLITMRGASLLQRANVVLHDALVEPEMLDYAPQALKVAVGKRCGKRSTAQHFINKQLVDYARQFEVVVRLKGGDAMLFGRAEEEMQALEKAGIDFEVVPGVTSALAASATIQRSLTLRRVARSVAFVTYSQAQDHQPQLRAPVQADSLVFYMPRNQANQIAQELLQQHSGKTPVVIIEACSTPRERFCELTLFELSQPKINHWFNENEPCLFLIGQVFALRETVKECHWQSA